MTTPQPELSAERLDELVRAALSHAEHGASDLAWACVQPMVQAQAEQPTVAEALLHVVACDVFDRPTSATVVRAVFDAHEHEPDVVARVGGVLESVHDIRFLNDAPPSDPLYQRVGERLVEMANAVAGGDGEDEGGESVEDAAKEARILRGLACVARVLGRSWDDVAEHSRLRLVALEPGRWEDHYDLGLFYKMRGRFAEGLVANRCAAALGGDQDDAVAWNTGICATGAREAMIAQQVWTRLGLEVELGRFGLPEGRFAQVKVRLAERPLAERTADAEADDPGLEESVWVERLSPCHGVIRSALMQELGVDYGDVVLFDGAPIAHHKHGDVEVPVFPHLATLVHAGYHVFPFTGTQARKGQIADLSERLANDAVLYVHTEQMITLCKDCWQNPELDHAHGTAEHVVVSGKLCAPPSIGPRELLASLDAAVEAEGGVSVLVPELCRAAGESERSDVEARRMVMLGG